MNKQKQKQNSRWLLFLAGFIAIAAGFGLALYVVPVGQDTAAIANSPYKAYARGPMAAFLIKPSRPAVADIAFVDEKGQPRKLSDWQGRVVLLNVWATWCGPCRKEMPMLANLQKQLGSDKFEVLAVSVDRKGTAVSGPFLKDTDADALALYADTSAKAIDAFGAPGLPLTILIDAKGREIGRLLGPASWDSAEAKALVEQALREP